MKTLAMVLTLAAASALYSFQSPIKGRLTVRVTDRSGHPMPGATITVRGRSETTKLSTTNIEGEYRAEIPLGEYILEASMAGFASESRPVRLNDDTLWVSVAPTWIDFSEPNYSATALSGKITFAKREQGPHWIRFVSLYGSEMVEAPIEDNGNYRAALNGDGSYMVWVLGNERFCVNRIANFGPRGPATLNINVTEPCKAPK